MTPVAKKTKKPAQAQSDRGEPRPRDEQIRVRAYELYVARGGAPGHEIDDWLQAEREFQRRSAAASGPLHLLPAAVSRGLIPAFDRFRTLVARISHPHSGSGQM